MWDWDSSPAHHITAERLPASIVALMAWQLLPRGQGIRTQQNGCFLPRQRFFVLGLAPHGQRALSLGSGLLRSCLGHFPKLTLHKALCNGKQLTMFSQKRDEVLPSMAKTGAIQGPIFSPLIPQSDSTFARSYEL